MRAEIDAGGADEDQQDAQDCQEGLAREATAPADADDVETEAEEGGVLGDVPGREAVADDMARDVDERVAGSRALDELT